MSDSRAYYPSDATVTCDECGGLKYSSYLDAFGAYRVKPCEGCGGVGRVPAPRCGHCKRKLAFEFAGTQCLCGGEWQ